MVIAAVVIFWISVAILSYSYVGYGVLSFLLVKFKKKPVEEFDVNYRPSVSIVIAAYNEKDCIEEKIKNTLSLNYPTEKIQYVVVTDGSDDGTEQIVAQYPQFTHLHQPVRQGKIAAIDRAMALVENPIVIFTDANTKINLNAILKLVRHFNNKQVGAVAGEKRILKRSKAGITGAGEGIYWLYESKLKKLDSELNSVVGAAGELFAIRRELYEKVPKDTIIEDFYLTLLIAAKGFKVVYEPEAFGSETASISIAEELKRKIRIAAGGIQAVVRLKRLLNPFKYGILTFQYISHRVLRWTLAPAALPMLLASNFYLALQQIYFYKIVVLLQLSVYFLGLMGWILEKTNIKIKLFFIPFYFFVMNYAVYIGFLRFLKGSQSVIWERAKREI